MNDLLHVLQLYVHTHVCIHTGAYIYIHIQLHLCMHGRPVARVLHMQLFHVYTQIQQDCTSSDVIHSHAQQVCVTSKIFQG
jgi:hypothetical protein